MEVFGKSNRTQRYCPYLEGIHNSDNILYIFRCNVMWSRIKALCFSHLLLAVLCQQSIQRVLWKWGDGIILKRLTRQACSHRLSYKCVNIQTRMGMQTFVSFCRLHTNGVLTKGSAIMGRRCKVHCTRVMVFPKCVYNFPYIQPDDGQISLQPNHKYSSSSSLEREADQPWSLQGALVGEPIRDGDQPWKQWYSVIGTKY